MVAVVTGEGSRTASSGTPSLASGTACGLARPWGDNGFWLCWSGGGGWTLSFQLGPGDAGAEGGRPAGAESSVPPQENCIGFP